MGTNFYSLSTNVEKSNDFFIFFSVAPIFGHALLVALLNKGWGRDGQRKLPFFADVTLFLHISPPFWGGKWSPTQGREKNWGERGRDLFLHPPSPPPPIWIFVLCTRFNAPPKSAHTHLLLQVQTFWATTVLFSPSAIVEIRMESHHLTVTDFYQQREPLLLLHFPTPPPPPPPPLPPLSCSNSSPAPSPISARKKNRLSLSLLELKEKVAGRVIHFPLQCTLLGVQEKEKNQNY